MNIEEKIIHSEQKIKELNEELNKYIEYETKYLKDLDWYNERMASSTNPSDPAFCSLQYGLQMTEHYLEQVRVGKRMCENNIDFEKDWIEELKKSREEHSCR